MGVLKADCSSTTSLLSKTISFPGGGWYMQADVAIPAATFAAIIANTSTPNRYSAFFLDLRTSGTTSVGMYCGNSSGNAAGLTSPATLTDNNGPGYEDSIFTADTWHTIILHYDGSTVHVTFDGTNYDTNLAGAPAAGNPTQLRVGGPYAAPYAGHIYYIDNVKVGTTLGGTDIFSDNFEGDLSGWTSADGDVSIVDDPFAVVVPPVEPAGAGGVRVMVAFDDPTLDPDPAWTDVTAISSSLVASFSIDRGRAFELDRTDTGTANVRINDRDGVLDPTNAAGPYYGLIEPLLQIRLDLWDPVVEAWSTLFRGYIEDYDYVVEPFTHQDQDGVTVGLNRLEIGCVDAFSILTAIEMQPGSFGNDPTSSATPDIASAQGIVYYENKRVNLRIDQALADGLWPPALKTVFTGNVYVQDSSYSPGDNILQVIQDAADAEFPGVANVYVSRLGIVTFHGRFARFDPEGISADAGDAWPFTHWKAGDEKAVLSSISDTAQVRSLSFNRGLSKIINQATATPTGIAEDDIADQVSTDPGSLATYGYRSWSAENLLTLGGTDFPFRDANDETKTYSDYMIAAFSAPQNRISGLTLRTIDKDDDRAAPTWALLAGAEISDRIDVTVTTPGEGGFNLEPCFIEGVHYEVGPLNGEYADVTLTLDLSPQVYYTGIFGGIIGSPEEPSSELAVELLGSAYEDETMTAVASGGV